MDRAANLWVLCGSPHEAPHPCVLCKGGNLGPKHRLFRIASLFCSCRCYFAVQTVALVIRPSGEEQLGG